MKIKSYKKDKNSMYQIELDNKMKVLLHEDLILKEELLLKKEISESKLNNLIKENQKYEVYTKCLKYLATKMRCEKEIKKKYKEYDDDAIEYAIERLTKEGYLSNKDYVKAYINDQVNLKMVGPHKIASDLKQLGFNESDYSDYLENISKDIWLEKINKLISKQVKTNHTKSNSMLLIHITNDLINKGYEKGMISEELSKIEFSSDKDILIKEINKLKRKYEGKVEESELDYLIINKLVAKGYNISDIKNNLSK